MGSVDARELRTRLSGVLGQAGYWDSGHMRRTAAVAVLCAAGLMGCSSAVPSDVAVPTDVAVPSDVATNQPVPSDVAVVYGGPAFSAPTLDGGFLSDADVAGQPTVMWFWAPWCGVCRKEAPQVAEAARELDGEAVVVGVGGFGETGAMREFVAERGLEGIPHLEDPAGRVWGAFGVVGQPTTVFMDAAGNLEVVPGVLTSQEIVDRARALASA